jgi:two-component system cell cycle sensor histidine kinase/response regulator CckA
MGTTTVLLVDDERSVATVIGMILERAGYRVLTASNAEDARAATKKHEGAIELLLCDVKLGNESGLQVAADTRAIHPELKVLYLSGFPLDVLLEQGLLNRNELSNGRTWYLQKPFLPSTLLQFVDEVLSPRCQALTAGVFQRLIGVEYGAY